MNQKYITLLPLELAFYEIHDKGYDPLNVIRSFWTNHHINDCHDNIEAVLQRYLHYSDTPDVSDANKKHTFFLDLMRLQIAYFQAHYHAIKLDHINFPFFKIPEQHENDLKIRRTVFDFFKRITE